jgi:hypothetical protein
VHAATQLDAEGRPDGFFSATPDQIQGAKAVRFALITGSRDFRRGNILDVFYGGFAKSGLPARPFDVPGMGHETANAKTLGTVLDFLDTR